MENKGIYSFTLMVDKNKVDTSDLELDNTTLEQIYSYTTRFENKETLLADLRQRYNIDEQQKMKIFISYRNRTKDIFLYKRDIDLLDKNKLKAFREQLGTSLYYNTEFRDFMFKHWSTFKHLRNKVDYINNKTYHQINQFGEDINMLLDNVFGAYKLNFTIILTYLSHLKYEEYRKQNFEERSSVSNKPVGKRTAQVFLRRIREILNDDNIFNKGVQQRLFEEDKERRIEGKGR